MVVASAAHGQALQGAAHQRHHGGGLTPHRHPHILAGVRVALVVLGLLGEADLAALDAAFPPGAAVGDRYPENLERLIDKG